MEEGIVVGIKQSFDDAQFCIEYCFSNGPSTFGV